MRIWKGLCVGAALVLVAAGPVLAQGADRAPSQETPAKATSPPARPFPSGATLAYVDLQVVGRDSVLGKRYAAEIEALRKKRSDELAAKNTALQAAQQKLAQTESVASEEARLRLQQDIDSRSRDLQFQTQEAQADVDNLKQELGRKFNAALGPILGQVAQARHVQLLFRREQGGVLWADPSLDLTEDVLKLLDASTAAGDKGDKDTRTPR